MKNNKKMILSSALILALSISIIKPSYAEDMGQNDEAVVTENEEVTIDENGNFSYDQSTKVLTDSLESNNESEALANDANLNSESTENLNTKERVRTSSYILDVQVKNRKTEDWIKPGSKFVIDGKSYILDRFSPSVSIKLAMNRSYNAEIKDSNGNTYATGSFTTPSEYGGISGPESLKVYMNLSENANQKKI